jgi:hypothetical protein
MRMYRMGERGQPCRSPLEMWKNEVGLPLTKGAIQGRWMQAEIQERNFSLNPNRVRNSREICA